MIQIISAIQRKGGAGKSTMLQSLAVSLANDNAKVVIIDTDPQMSCMKWAESLEIKNLDVVEHVNENSLRDMIQALSDRNYDVILIDTAGYDSRIASYAIKSSNLLLVPTSGSKSSIQGSADTWKHIDEETENLKIRPIVKIVMWNVNIQSNIFSHSKKQLENANLPLLDVVVPRLTGFEEMSWNGGMSVKSSTRKAVASFISALQRHKLIDFYEDK
ncbi:MAG: ParA family protein [Rhizobiales bacterium]|nr:ParA family protein [Hyphomicrobiales bacterium]